SGYDKGLSSGVVAAAGTLGSLIPPSILLLIYGIFAEVPIGQLFIAGVVPGVLTALMCSLMIVTRVKLNPSLAPRVEIDVTWGERFGALWEMWPVIFLVIGVFGGLFAGAFTPTEAGAIGALLSFVIGFAKRTLNWRAIYASLMETLS